MAFPTALWRLALGALAVLAGCGAPRTGGSGQAGAVADGAIAIRFGALVDGTGRVVRDAVVVVDADTIVSVATGARAIPPGARVIDLSRYTGIPGMIDAHTHMTYWRDKVNDPLGARAPRSRDSIIAAAAENARRTLETGVTTVRDLGASNYTDIAMRDAINRGEMVGPRMFVAGYGLSKATGRGGAAPARNPANGRIVDSIDIGAAVKAQADAGADWIKMYGSTGSFQNVTGRQTFTDREMQLAVAAARAAGKPIAIHSYGDSGGRAAMRGGGVVDERRCVK
jgi:imidazolonepropionase-like amidohydrolase